MMIPNWMTAILAASACIVLAACPEQDSTSTGSETHWLACDSDADCPAGNRCVAKTCEPDIVLDAEDMASDSAVISDACIAPEPTCCPDDGNLAASLDPTCVQGAWRCPPSSSEEACADMTEADMGAGDADMSDTPVEISAKHTVTFTVRNTSTETLYLVTEGLFCDPYGLRPVGGAPLTLSLGYDCGCECPAPPTLGMQGLLAIAPNGTHDLFWDGRLMSTFEVPLECGADISGFTSTQGARVPVNAGDYEVSIGFVQGALPQECNDTGMNTFQCDPGPGNGEARRINTICPEMSTAQATFTLPAQGPTNVEVTIP